jgi:hypothetical protein
MTQWNRIGPDGQKGSKDKNRTKEEEGLKGTEEDQRGLRI